MNRLDQRSVDAGPIHASIEATVKISDNFIQNLVKKYNQ